MLYYNRIDLSKDIDPAKSNNRKVRAVWYYCFFNHGFRFQDSVYNACQYLTIFCLNISNINFITVKGVDYRWIIHDISKSKAIRSIKTFLLDVLGHT